MTLAPLQSDSILWQSLRTRRQRLRPLRGLDALANRWVQRARHARRGPSYLRRVAETVDRQSAAMAALTDTELDEQIQQVREVFARRAWDGEPVRTALAVIREVVSRQLGQKPHVEQIMGALGMFHGQIVEMVTGEGKTLVGAVAATMLAWSRRPVHIITVNDYLAERDAEWNQPIYNRCGVSVGVVVNETSPAKRSQMYSRPVLYTTQKELVADWLRDQLRLGPVTDPVSPRWLRESGMQGIAAMVPGLQVVVLDEVDAVLIDEAVTPLIIAQPRREDPQASLYERARRLADRLVQREHYDVDQRRRQVTLTAAGQQRLDSAHDDSEHALWRAARRREELVEQALSASHCYHEGQHYQIVEDQVLIVDEYTGRFMRDRQWQHGLHQSVEAKHELPITADRDTLASMSFQRFFRHYPHLCGMTGTAADARAELETTYGLPVRSIPTHRTLRRLRLPDHVYVSTGSKWRAVVAEVIHMHGLGRPVLIGTRSIEASEVLSGLLTRQCLDHQVLNAVHHKQEAAIIAGAGQAGGITVATNMAGRGTDIKLAPGVERSGGLHVVLTERHAARRIDRQMIGRAGRQGDPGSARCILSLEDELLLKHAPMSAALLRRVFGGRQAALPVWVSHLFDLAQRRAQRRAFRARAAVVRHEQELDQSLPG